MAAVILTVDQYKSWEKTGKSEFLKFCKVQVSGIKHGRQQTKELKRALYEASWQVLMGRLKIDSALAAFQDVLEMHNNLPSLLVDVFSVMDVETMIGDNKNHRDRFLALIAGVNGGLVPDAVLKERLDQETLEGSGVLESRQNFQAKYVKIKTKLYYRQQKFNLLREECEGYSKLIAELSQDLSDVTQPQMLECIRSLVGCFNLDPNRVLDVILESFECRPTTDSFFIPLIREYMADHDTLCHVLGFKFHFYPQQDGSETPASLYKVAALMLYHNLLDLDTLYPHLSPLDSDIIERHQREVLEARTQARKLTVVSLADKNEEKNDKEDKEKEKEHVPENQKMGLCEALLTIGDWIHAKAIMDQLPPFSLVSQPVIASAVCRLVHHLIEPIYTKHSGLPTLISKRRAIMTSPDVIGVRQVEEFEDLLGVTFPLLQHLGPHLHGDAILLGKLLRIARAFMTKRAEEPDPFLENVYRGWLTVLDEVVLPTLSLLPANCCLSEEVWSVVKLLPYEHRYRLYGQWKNETYALHPKLVRSHANCIDRCKYVMKRLSKENVKPLGRQIGKLSHSNPTILFEYILSQIQRFDNFIGPVVDSLKYLTPLSYDVLAYCIIEALANPERERLKHDDTNISMWLQALASFCGAICKKYPIELAGLVQYVVNQLKAGKSYDLLILREVLQKMAGVEVSEEITMDQLEAMGGGELLRQEGGNFTQVRNTKKSSTRLRDALMEHNLAIPLCILMAQQRHSILYNVPNDDDKRHIKLIGKLYDQCQDTFVQFISFLSLSLSVDEIGKRLPNIDAMMSDFHVAPDAAFSLARNIYANSINSKYEELRKADKKEKNSAPNLKHQRYLEAVQHVIDPVVALVRNISVVRGLDDLSPQFYVTFWTLSMYDLVVPTAAYEKQIQILEQQIKTSDENKEMAQSKRKKEQERCKALKDKLVDERTKQEAHVKLILGRLEHERDQWFLGRSTKNICVTAFLQNCVFPRCCFTTVDAVYCAHFINILHKLKTPNFSSLICYDRIFADVTFSVTSCTESEAHRYGRFLCATLDTIMRWHGDGKIYEEECSNYPGFVTVFRAKGGGSNKADQLDYQNFRHVCHKWHFSLTKAMVACLESGNFIQIRNALIILTKILPRYPCVVKFGQALERRVEKLCAEEKEKRQDLYALAVGYSGQLHLRKRTWVMESDFHIKDKEPAKGANAAAAKANGQSSAKQDASASAQSEASGSQADKVKKEPASKEPQKGTSGGQDKKAEHQADGKDKRPEAEKKAQVKEKHVEVKEKRAATEAAAAAARPVKVERHMKDGERLVGKTTGNMGAAADPSPTAGPSKEKKEKTSKEKLDKAERAAEKAARKENKERKEKKEEKMHKEEKVDVPKEKDPKVKHIERKKDDEHGREFDREYERDYERDRDRDLDRDHDRAYYDEKDRHRVDKSREKERMRKDDRRLDDWDVERSSSVNSNSSAGSHHLGGRHSAEPSPKTSDDRDIKRRKVENPHTKSPSHERERLEREKEKERSRKRDRSSDHDVVDMKRHKADEFESPSTSGRRASSGAGPYTNGSDPMDDKRSHHRISKSMEHTRSRSRDRELDLTPERSERMKKSGKKESPELKERKSDKHSKKSKK